MTYCAVADAIADVQSTMEERIALAQDDFDFSRTAMNNTIEEFRVLAEELRMVRSLADSRRSVLEALVKLETAQVQGRRPSKEILSAVSIEDSDGRPFSLPASILDEAKSVPTNAQIAEKFELQLQHLVAAAFSPPASSLSSSFLSHCIGRFFASLYDIHLGAAQFSVAGDLSRETAVNLKALQSAAQHVKHGDVGDALALLDQSLTGPCRAQASGWMSEARRAIELCQLRLAVQARLGCLVASTSSQDGGA